LERNIRRSPQGHQRESTIAIKITIAIAITSLLRVYPSGIYPYNSTMQFTNSIEKKNYNQALVVSSSSYLFHWAFNHNKCNIQMVFLSSGFIDI